MDQIIKTLVGIRMIEFMAVTEHDCCKEEEKEEGVIATERTGCRVDYHGACKKSGGGSGEGEKGRGVGVP